ncbi:MAG: hypothetical protein RQ826_02500 [Xanthomonadales bacterium]|nr:hypothetical protein [Xanthomonadales bacterium]
MNLFHRRLKFVILTSLAPLVLLLGTSLSARDAIPEKMLSALEYRLIGPMRGGRVNRVQGIAGDPTTYYFGAAAGGVWKTTDGGINWLPIFDDQPVAAIGDLAIAESNPDILYVGTGDSNPRGNVSHGNGVYKSVDGGATWRHLGLADSRHIGRVLIHPENPDIVFVAAVGHIFGSNEQRGVFRTRDGGESWEKVLYVDAQTGAYDISFVPGDPGTLYATTWQVLRDPHRLVSGGPGSGLHRSTDGGATWQRLSGNGLPETVLGKIGVAVSPADPSRVYALIEAEQGGLYRSDDHGQTWKHINGSRNLWRRAWFFMDVIPHPTDPDVVYVMNINLQKSVDGGENFSTMKAHHVDHHDLWIDPQNPARMISGNDGGANISFNGGLTWLRSDDNQPTGQFYRVITDDRFPYYVYGGQQDWETIAIASRGNWNGVGQRDWYPVGGCEMGWAAPDKRTHNYVYAGCTDGGVSRYDHRTERNQSVDPWPETNIGHGAEDATFRFKWTSPMMLSEHDPATLYMGANVLFQSSDDGMSWSRISPDLTRDDKSRQKPSGGPITRDNVGTEVYGTLFALAESSLQQGLLWAGSDDGLVHLTRDGGKNWQNVTPPVDILPEWSTINSIEASRHEEATAYLAVQRRDWDDYRPYVYRTDDFGANWTRIVEGLPDDTFVRVLREDPVRPGLLYLGTEMGVYFSLDGGKAWQSMQLNLPVAPVYDLTIKNNDLVVATHGRAFWILDDLTPLREMSHEVMTAKAHLFTPSTAYRIRDDFVASTTPVGENPPPGAIIYYTLQSETQQPASLTITDQTGDVVRRFSSEGGDSPATGTAFRDDRGHPGSEGKLTLTEAPNTIETSGFPDVEDTGAAYSRSTELRAGPGLHRFVWDLRYPGARGVPGRVAFWHRPKSPPIGPLALPGEYTVSLEVDGTVLSAPLVIEADPRLAFPESELQAQFDLHIAIRDTLTEISEAVLTLRDIRSQLDQLEAPAAETEGSADLLQRMEAVREQLDNVEAVLTEPRMEGPADAFHYPIKLDNKVGLLMGTVANSDRAPTRQSREVFEKLGAEADQQFRVLGEILEDTIPSLNEALVKNDLPALKTPKTSSGRLE